MPPDCRSSSQLPLRLVILPFSTTVAPFLHTTTLDPRTPDLYNSHHHSHSSIAALIPSIPHVNPSHHPSYYRHWLPVITSSRHLSPDDIHIITLPRPYAAQLLHAGQFGIQTLRVHESDKEDLSEEFPRVTTRGVRVADLFGASGEGGIEKEYFLRTDACSVKDGKNGTQPIRSVEDIWTRLATSHRVIHGLEHLFGEGAAKETEAGGEDKVETGVGNEREEWLEPAGKKEKQAGAKAASIDLYLIRFNPHITSAHEY
ncbi:hypothetical protein MMC06_005766, partial [Schaereria dolodes]|nr:hypothetical protein [Schaereria dolodes]